MHLGVVECAYLSNIDATHQNFIHKEYRVDNYKACEN